MVPVNAPFRIFLWDRGLAQRLSAPGEMEHDFETISSRLGIIADDSKSAES